MSNSYEDNFVCDNQRRKRGIEDKYSDLLIKAEACTAKEVESKRLLS